jgi:hypothetical protein
MKGSTLCVGGDVHLDKITLCVVDKADGHEVVKRFRVTNNLPGAQAAVATIAEVATRSPTLLSSFILVRIPDFVFYAKI